MWLESLYIESRDLECIKLHDLVGCDVKSKYNNIESHFRYRWWWCWLVDVGDKMVWQVEWQNVYCRRVMSVRCNWSRQWATSWFVSAPLVLWSTDVIWHLRYHDFSNSSGCQSNCSSFFIEPSPDFSVKMMHYNLTPDIVYHNAVNSFQTSNVWRVCDPISRLFQQS